MPSYDELVARGRRAHRQNKVLAKDIVNLTIFELRELAILSLEAASDASKWLRKHLPSQKR